MLYQYRYKSKKDFYICDIKTIKKAFARCIRSINCMNQGGGNIMDDEISSLKQNIISLQKEIKKLKVKLNS